MRMRTWVLGMGAALGTLLAQDTGDRITVPFRDAAKPRTLAVKLINGGMTIHGYEGKDVIIEARGGATRSSRRSNVPEGMHRLDSNSFGVDVTEENNVITVHGGMMRSTEVTIQVPQQTALRLSTLNGGKIEVENVSGEIEAENMNGSITILQASGSVVANSMNGKITVSLARVTPNKTMSFSTMNGTVDVTLPADTKANLRMKSENGDIFTDFEVKMEGSRSPVVDDQRKTGGRYRVRTDKSLSGTINGGGPEIQFTTFNGSILIHKK
jgi:Putative adhesin